MLKQLRIETVYGVIDLVGALRELSLLNPRPKIVDLKSAAKEYLFPSTRLGKLQRRVDLGLLNIVKGLRREERIELVALMWLGRDGGDWQALLQQGKSEVDGRDTNMPVYVTDKADLDVYLDDGLEQLGLKRRNPKAEEPPQTEDDE